MCASRDPWRSAVVTGIHDETANAKTFRLQIKDWSQHLAGQHCIVRLVAPDGYTASRSYSIASAPDDSAEIEISVERLPGGEVSTFLHDEVRVGDELQVRGPIGGWFVWRGDSAALLIGGGSGVVPLMSMLRYARRRGTSDLVRLVVSVRSPDDLYYASELPGPETRIIYSRTGRPSGVRPPGRLRAEDLVDMVLADAVTYVCGSSPFADVAADLAINAGIPAEHIRVERFGPSG